MFQRCLVSTDLSDGLYRLADFVPSLSKSGIKQIVFMHSVPMRDDGGIPRTDNEKIEEVRSRFSRVLGNVPDEVEVHVEVPSGRPLDMITKVADTYQADVILTGMPIRSTLQEKLFGSTTFGLAKSQRKPLMILRPQLVSTYTREELDLRCQHLWRYLLIPYDGSSAAEYLLQRLKAYAKNRPENSLEQCTLCWVVDDAHLRQIPKDQQLKEARAKLELIKADLEELGLQVSLEVLLGNPLTKILELAVDLDISAIAISSGSLGSFMEWSAPSFAGELLRHSWHPVLLFPPKK